MTKGLAAVLELYLRTPRLLRLLAPVLVMYALWRLSAQQSIPLGPVQLSEFAHNSMHIFAYGGLGAAWFLALSDRAERKLAASRSKARIAVLLAVVYGIVDEVHQSYVPERTASAGDVLSDFSGATLAVLVLLSVGDRDRTALRILPWWLVVCVGSVAFATYGPC
ncbi:MAG: VanZ family protein [Planctomycetes bacterium]|nr:VanZ family protein [Planctomycetota bacterium]MCB9883871.1 VanZ family protein [Planctomycetota bacterium]